MSRRFMISSLLAAGLGHNDALQASLTRATSTNDSDNKNLFQVFRQDHLYTLAGHSSHSSHASHSSGSGGYSGGHFSHTSHYSSTGGYSSPTYTPQPVYSAPPTAPQSSPSTAPQPLTENTPSSPSSSLKPLPGHSALFKSIVKRLQVALIGRGLFEGPINGTVGPSTRAAIRKFQETQGLQVTGTITPETLDALHVPST